MAKVVKNIKLFSGSASDVGVVQADTPGAVITLFVTPEQIYSLFEQARVALVRLGKPDPLEKYLPPDPDEEK